MDVEETTAVPADAQTLRLQWQDAALELAVAQEGDEWLLYRRDAPLRYRFSANQGKRLLELQESVPADGAPPAAAPPTGEPAAEAPAAP